MGATLCAKAGTSITPGKQADLIMISKDLFKVAPSEIANTEVLFTMVGGQMVYQAPGWPGASTAAEVK